MAMTDTYSELLRRHARVRCSCCGKETGIGQCMATTNDDDIVEWLRCSDCYAMCDRRQNRAGQVDCSFDPCVRDPQYTRLSQAQYERWRAEMGDG
jgi:hypothetical protein